MGCLRLEYLEFTELRTERNNTFARGKNGAGIIVSGLNHLPHFINSFLSGLSDKKDHFFAILHDKEGANGAGHGAVAGGKIGGKAWLVSKEGVIDADHDGEHDNKGVYGKSDPFVKTYDSFKDLLIQNPKYEDGLIFAVTKSQQESIYNVALTKVYSDYNLFWNSCIDVCRSSLGATNFPKYKPVNPVSIFPNAQFLEYRRTYKNYSIYVDFTKLHH